MTFIYALSDPGTGEVRYIGKAKDLGKRLRAHLSDADRRRTPVYDWIRSMRANGATPQISLVEEVPDIQWREAEIRWIRHYRQLCPKLLNVADGGDEPHCANEVRAKNGRLNAAIRDKTIWRLKQRMGIALKKGNVTEHTKAKLRKAAAIAPHLFGEYARV